ncbi:Sec-independent protein translocase protein TatB [Simonsiella muelleri]|uniref:Sec-independent protein translocase protein TatB n=1 Tax=Simonsiella muelleri ATCC 29453 TaxID=641147 RepID=V9HL77_9NEIS|nr:Sec-independent protein translocase protein TatB [Simonsiella muelleri]AUX61124.1 twin arginine-targeting protein translocase TatB [Simonsiella muelleri ATCC 29453]EFG30929.1 twin arginine-targeting protein translocase TatB [Simonsiella muelleri ATCC 29453]UBQ53174.1 Sec-independent protein translocase protein TatB [Simonsiella muelleri]
MFDFSFTEMLLAGVVALIVLGPERLPKVARFIGEWVGKIQRLATGVKSELTNHAEYTDLLNIKNQVQQTTQEIREDLRDFEEKIQTKTEAWKNLPEQKTPADFGVDEHGFPIFSGSPNTKSQIWQVKSLKKQSMSRKRDMRPRHRTTPKLRMRK